MSTTEPTPTGNPADTAADATVAENAEAQLAADAETAVTQDQEEGTALAAAENTITADTATIAGDQAEIAKLQAEITPVTPPPVTPPPTPTGASVDINTVFSKTIAQWGNPPSISTSAALISKLVSHIPPATGANVSPYSFGVNNGNNGTSLVRVPAKLKGSPFTVKVNSGANNFVGTAAGMVPATVYLPGPTWTRGSSDSPLSIYYEDTDELIEIWQATVSGSTVTGSWGGYIPGYSKSAGVFPSPYGVSASGLAMAGLIVTFADITAGVIGHPISFCAPYGTGPNVAPADRYDMGNSPGDISEGTWLQLPASALNGPFSCPFEKLVITAGVNYGAICTDLGGAYMVQCEGPQTGEADAIAAQFGGLPEYSVLPNWTKALSGARVLTPPAHWPTSF